MMFRDRKEAGERLARELTRFADSDPVILALPRGGVPVGFEIARVLNAPLDVVLVRKIGAPDRDELALGAIAEGDPPELVTTSNLIDELGVTAEYLERATAKAIRELERRRRVYVDDRPVVRLAGRMAIVVDDGIATGATMRAALLATRRREPMRLVLAVPVAPAHSLELLAKDADEAVCLDTPEPFFGVGQFYRSFPQLRDDEVTRLLEAARALAHSEETGE